MMDTGPGATESLAAEDLLQQLSRDLGLPDFMEEDASSSSAFSDHLVADPFTVEGRTHGHVSTVRGLPRRTSAIFHPNHPHLAVKNPSNLN